MALTPAELLEKALNGESLDDDHADEATKTTTTSEEPKDNNTEGAADAAKTGAADQGKATGGAGTTEDDEPKGAPIASKSGAYTIPYEKLEQSRERVKSLEGENESLRAQLAELNAKQQANLEQAEDKAQARADAGKAQTQADQNLEAAKTAMGQGVDASLFGDFSEEGIAKGIAALMGRTREELREELRAELREEAARELKPIKDREAKEVKDEHYGAIFEKHPDANEIVQSVEFKAWVNGLPGFQRGAVDAVLHPQTGGTAAQVIEVFDTFKAQTGKAAAPAAQDKGKAPEVQRRVPNSLSEIAGEQHQDIAQQVMASAGSDPQALIERMQDMTPEQIERVMNAI